MRNRLLDTLQRLPALLGFAPGLLLAGPVLSLAGYWIAGERGLVIGALALSLVALVVATTRGQGLPAPLRGDLFPRSMFLADLDRAVLSAGMQGKGTGCVVLQFDDAVTLLDRHGRATQIEVIRRIGERIIDALRQGDRVMQLEGGGFAVALAPARRLDLEAMVQLASRLQAVAAEPVAIGGLRFLLSCSAGFCLSGQLPAQTGAGLLDAAQIAADDARTNGPGALRAYAPGMGRKRADRDARRAELEAALDEGQIRAWFQPQVSADTGEITGFEALARWQHPERGLIPPSEFLPDIGSSGLSERLSEVMLFNALVALSRWDSAGLSVPMVGVNFSGDELRNPRLADKLKWELDRFDLVPGRLAIEVLETVTTTTDSDIVVRNVDALSRLGCRIDLDDFGTGHSSISNIRRLAVHRLKIDRSFVARVDQDREQQRVVSAILSMAERLGLDTLAEGVETRAELTILAQLGCGHVQGFGIAKPMPFEQTLPWMQEQRGRPAPTWPPGRLAT